MQYHIVCILCIKQNTSNVVHSFNYENYEKRSDSDWGASISASSYGRVHLLHSAHIGVFCANGIVMTKNNSLLKAVMFFCTIFPAVLRLFIQHISFLHCSFKYIYFFGHIKIDLAHRSIHNWCHWSNHKVCIESCWDIVVVIALFTMYHRKILAQENGLINYLVLSPSSINQFYF